MLRYLLIDIPARRRALTLWAILAAAVCVKTLWFGGDCSVYRMYAGAARHWWADQSLYGGYTVSEGLDGYRYSPTFAVALTPFYCLPGNGGAIAWSLMSIAALVCAMHALTRDVLPGPWRATACSQAVEQRSGEPALLASKQWHTGGWPPSREGWFLGLVMVGSVVGLWSLQANAIVTALIGLALAAIARQRWWTAALWLAIPVFIKLWPIALVLLLAICWPRQLIGRFAAVCVVLASIPFLTRPPNIVAWQYHEWYLDITGPLQGRWPGYRDAWTIWEQLCPLLNLQANWEQAAQRHAYMALQLLTATGVLGWCLWQRHRRGLSQFSRRDGHGHGNRLPRRENGTVPLDPLTNPGVPPSGHLLTLILSMWASWQLLFGPGTEQLTYGIIAPSASWAVLVSFAEKRARWLTSTAWAMLALLPSGDIEQTICAAIPGGTALLPLGVVLFVVWLVWHEGDRIYD